jgi:hypothetical protein
VTSELLIIISIPFKNKFFTFLKEWVSVSKKLFHRAGAQPRTANVVFGVLIGHFDRVFNHFPELFRYSCPCHNILQNLTHVIISCGSF